MKKFQKSKKTAISGHRKNHSGRSLVQLPQLCPDIQLPPLLLGCRGPMPELGCTWATSPSKQQPQKGLCDAFLWQTPAWPGSHHTKVQLGGEQIVNAWEEYQGVILTKKKRKKKEKMSFFFFFFLLCKPSEISSFFLQIPIAFYGNLNWITGDKH